MAITYYHNPRCSKSRKTLELLEQAGIAPTIVEYLKSPPAAATTLRNAKLIGVRVADLLRRGENEFKNAHDLPDLDDDAALADLLLHPIDRAYTVPEVVALAEQAGLTVSALMVPARVGASSLTTRSDSRHRRHRPQRCGHNRGHPRSAGGGCHGRRCDPGR